MTVTDEEMRDLWLKAIDPQRLDDPSDPTQRQAARDAFNAAAEEWWVHDALDRFDRLRELHQDDGSGYCGECNSEWPCYTRDIIDGSDQ